MAKLSAFADEVGQDLELQLDVMRREGVDNIELRGVWDKNVMKLTVDEVKRVKQAATAAGIGFSAVGSPLGKFPLDGDFREQIEDVKRALEFAAILEAPYIRIFSYFIPEGQDPARHRTQVMDQLGALTAEAEKTDTILAHENERDIYGDTGARCLDIHQTIKNDHFTGIFDFANFVQCGQRPYIDCWPILKAHTTYFHVKDSRLADKKVTPAGAGDGYVEKILGEAFADGFDNFLTLEPHLSVAEASYGRTSEALFHTAVQALKDILSRVER